MTDDKFGPELFHYTDLNGLKGIFKSGTMFATRYDRLNDRTEISHLKDIVIDGVVKILSKDRDFSSLPEIGKRVADVIDKLYDTAFGTNNEKGLAVPYITSFCSHHDDHAYERENGLLSQWRGYGNNESYALVFDTAALMRRAQQEYNSHPYSFRGFCRVKYNDDDARNDPEYATLARKIVETMRASMNSEEEKAAELAYSVYTDLINHSVFFKHRAFSEEREVRMAYSPATEFVQNIWARNPAYKEEKPLKKIFLRGPNCIPTVSIFEGMGLAGKLPLLRIIIGPNKNQDESLMYAEEITKGTVKLVKSETPFV